MAAKPHVILVDTTVWIDLFRASDTPEKLALQRLLDRGQAIVITDIILTEILRGISSNKEYRAVQRRLEAFFRLPAEAPRTFIHAAQLYRECRKKAATIRSTVDCLIAAVCIEYDVALLHSDSDFDLLAKHTKLRIVQPLRA